TTLPAREAHSSTFSANSCAAFPCHVSEIACRNSKTPSFTAAHAAATVAADPTRPPLLRPGLHIFFGRSSEVPCRHGRNAVAGRAQPEPVVWTGEPVGK